MDGNDNAESFDNSQMIGDCDRLIETFIMGDSDWRRFLVFNNNKWCDIRNQFFTHCQDRAENEHDLLMKNKLLLLGNNLKQVSH